MTAECDPGTGWTYCAHVGGLTACRCSCTCADQRHCTLIGQPTAETQVIAEALSAISSLQQELDVAHAVNVRLASRAERAEKVAADAVARLEESVAALDAALGEDER